MSTQSKAAQPSSESIAKELRDTRTDLVEALIALEALYDLCVSTSRYRNVSFLDKQYHLVENAHAIIHKGLSND